MQIFCVKMLPIRFCGFHFDINGVLNKTVYRSWQNGKKSVPLHLINGPVVQLNRMSDSGSEDHGFESHRGHLIEL